MKNKLQFSKVCQKKEKTLKIKREFLDGIFCILYNYNKKGNINAKKKTLSHLHFVQEAFWSTYMTFLSMGETEKLQFFFQT